VTIRPFAPGDIAEVRALWARCEGLGDGPGDDPEALARFLARNPDCSAVALEDGTIVGAALCGHDGRRGFLYRVGVDPSRRRKGIARALAAHGFDALRAQGISRAMLFLLSDNVEAGAFWASVGGRKRASLALWSVDL
jgi:ribosomal protein S18 acetylase RimI-like enzyme